MGGTSNEFMQEQLRSAQAASNPEQAKAHDVAIIQQVVLDLIAENKDTNPQIDEYPDIVQTGINVVKNAVQFFGDALPDHKNCVDWTDAFFQQLQAEDMQYYLTEEWQERGPMEVGDDSMARNYEWSWSGHQYARMVNPTTGEYVEVDIWKRGSDLHYGKGHKIAER